MSLICLFDSSCLLILYCVDQPHESDLFVRFFLFTYTILCGPTSWVWSVCLILPVYLYYTVWTNLMSLICLLDSSCLPILYCVDQPHESDLFVRFFLFTYIILCGPTSWVWSVCLIYPDYLYYTVWTHLMSLICLFDSSCLLILYCMDQPHESDLFVWFFLFTYTTLCGPTSWVWSVCCRWESFRFPRLV